MKKIPYILIATIMLLPFGVSAASFTFSPAIGSYVTNQTFTTSVFVTPAAGESISASKVSLTFPADKLEVVSYTPVNGGNILAHIGTVKDNVAGTIVDNVAFNPAITSSTKVATVTFKAKAEGNAQLSVSSDSKLLDSTNSDKKTGSTPATYTVSVPTPPTAPVTTPTVDAVVTPPSAPTTAPQVTSDGVADTQASATGEGQEEGDGAATTTEEEASTTTATTTDDNVDQVAAAAGAGVLGLIKSKWYYGLLLLLLSFFGWFIWKKRKKKTNY